MSATYEVMDSVDNHIKGHMIVSKRHTIGGTLGVGDKALTLFLAHDPTQILYQADLNTVTGEVIAPFDLVRVVLVGIQDPWRTAGISWSCRWKYLDMDRRRQRTQTPDGTMSWQLVLEPLQEELKTTYIGNWTTTDATDPDGNNAAAKGTAHFDAPVVDAITTQALTKHCVMFNHQNDGSLNALFNQTDIFETLNNAVGIGGPDWWYYIHDANVDGPRHLQRATIDAHVSNISAVLSENPGGGRKIFNEIRGTAGSVLDTFDFLTPLRSHRTVTTGPFSIANVGHLEAPHFNDLSIQDQGTLDRRLDAALARHQFLDVGTTVRVTGTPEHPVPICVPGDKIIFHNDSGGAYGPLYVIDWDIEEWEFPDRLVQVLQLNTIWGDYLTSSSVSRQNALTYLTMGNIPPIGSSSGGSCCGSEILMAEATTQQETTPYITVSADGIILSIPINVDVTNARIRVLGHFWISGTGSGSPAFTITGADGTSRSVPADSSAAWHEYTFEVPALSVIAEGTHTIAASINGVTGTTLVGYQVLVFLVTSG